MNSGLSGTVNARVGSFPWSDVINVLLPDTDKPETGEEIFSAYQRWVLAFSEMVQALPFACITGYKKKDPRHILDLRGFRFFYGPSPEVVVRRINEVLDNLQNMNLPGISRDERRRYAMASQQLLFCHHGEERIGHSILEDIKLYTHDTALIELWEAMD